MFMRFLVSVGFSSTARRYEPDERGAVRWARTLAFLLGVKVPGKDFGREVRLEEILFLERRLARNRRAVLVAVPRELCATSASWHAAGKRERRPVDFVVSTT
jgi:hypothetical protein